MDSAPARPIDVLDAMALLSWLDHQVGADTQELATRARRPGETDALAARRELVAWARRLVAAALNDRPAPHTLCAAATALDATRLLSVHYTSRPGYDPRWIQDLP